MGHSGVRITWKARRKISMKTGDRDGAQRESMIQHLEEKGKRYGNGRSQWCAKREDDRISSKG
jgi:hypothetical protein